MPYITTQQTGGPRPGPRPKTVSLWKPPIRPLKGLGFFPPSAAALIKPVVRTPDLDAEFPAPTPLQKLSYQKGASIQGSGLLDKIGSGVTGAIKGAYSKLFGGGTSAPAPAVPSGGGFSLTSPVVLLGVAGVGIAAYFLFKKKGRR